MRHINNKIILVLLLLTSFLIAQNAWINEIHYDNFGTDTLEFIEVVIENANSYSLSDFTVELYNGNNGSVYKTVTLDQFTQGNTVDNFTFFYHIFPTNGIQNGSPDGMALSYQGNLITGQFLSYEGTFTATAGTANGLTSVDIGVSEPDTIGYSLQLGGSGATYDAFYWQEPLPATPGELNQNQQFSTTIKDEPSNHVTDFMVDSVSASSIYLSWNGATGAVLPDKYLLIGVKDGATFPTPSDGVPMLDDFDWSDGVAVFNLVHKDGKNTYTVNHLESETSYHFRIYPYTNAAENINYKTDGTIPEASATTAAVPIMSIAQIQKTPDGQEGDSPFKGQIVTIQGVVTGITSYSFFVQDADSAWSGINVYAPDYVSTLAMGDRIQVTGTVNEHYGKTELSDVSTLTILEHNVALPKPITVATGQVAQEKYEGVLLRVKNATCTNPDLGHGEWEVNDGSGPCRVDDLILKDFTPVFNQTYNITGVCDYSYSNFKLEPRTLEDVQLITTAPVVTFMGFAPLVPTADQDFVDTVKVTDNGTVVTVELRYQINYGLEKAVTMNAVIGDSIFTATIPATDYNDGDLVEYWIYAKDNDGEETFSETHGFFAGTSSIAILKQIDDQGQLLVDGYYARTTGVATVASGVFDTANLNVYIQDENYSGINIFKYNAGDVTIVQGHQYTVVGQLSQYRGLTEIVPENPQTDIIDNGQATMPDPLLVTLNVLISSAETFESLLIKVENADTVAGQGQWPTPGNNANLTITDDGGTTQVTLRIDKDTNIDEASAPTWPQTITGIFTQYDSNLPLLDGYQILPRTTADLSGLTGIEEDQKTLLPAKITLRPAFPNPFNPSTTLTLEIPVQFSNKETFSLEIYNILGQKIATLIKNKKLAAGLHKITWKAENQSGTQLPSGLYLAILKTQNKIWTQKLILLK